MYVPRGARGGGGIQYKHSTWCNFNKVLISFESLTGNRKNKKFTSCLGSAVVCVPALLGDLVKEEGATGLVQTKYGRIQGFRVKVSVSSQKQVIISIRKHNKGTKLIRRHKVENNLKVQ